MRQVVVPTDGGSRVELVVDYERPVRFSANCSTASTSSVAMRGRHSTRSRTSRTSSKVDHWGRRSGYWFAA